MDGTHTKTYIFAGNFSDILKTTLTLQLCKIKLVENTLYLDQFVENLNSENSQISDLVQLFCPGISTAGSSLLVWCISNFIKYYFVLVSVLYFSWHRFEHQNFWPWLSESNYDAVGQGKGKGFTINVPWNQVNVV